MKFSSLKVISAFIGILAFSSPSFAEEHPDYPQSQKRAVKIANTVLQQLEKSKNHPDRTETETAEFQKKTLTLFTAKKFTELDKALEEIAGQKKHSADDYYFFQEIVDIFSKKYDLTKNFDLWRKTSGSAHSFALSANHYIDLAWRSRGNGYANSVTQPGWKSFGENLKIATGLAKKALELDPTHPSALAIKITISMATGSKVKDIEKLYLNAIKHHPTNGKYFEMAAYACTPRWSGDTAGYQDFIEKHGPKAAVDGSTIWAIQLFLSEATQWRRRDPALNANGPSIIATQNRILSLWLRHAEDKRTFHQNLGWRIYEQSGYYLSLHIAAAGVQKYPLNASFHRLLGQSLYFLDQEAQALPILQKASQLEPDHHWVWYYLGSTNHILKKWKDCLKAHKKSVKLLEPHRTKEFAWAYYQASDAAYHLGKLDEAKKLGEESLRKDGAKYCSRVVLVLVQTALDQKDRPAARKYLEDGTAINPRLLRSANEKFPGWQEW